MSSIQMTNNDTPSAAAQRTVAQATAKYNTHHTIHASTDNNTENIESIHILSLRPPRTLSERF